MALGIIPAIISQMLEHQGILFGLPFFRLIFGVSKGARGKRRKGAGGGAGLKAALISCSVSQHSQTAC